MSTRTKFIFLLFVVGVMLLILACGSPTWAGPDGKECFSTVQKGCLDSLMEAYP